jgi:uncharacterized membrane protein YccC
MVTDKLPAVILTTAFLAILSSPSVAGFGSRATIAFLLNLVGLVDTDTMTMIATDWSW